MNHYDMMDVDQSSNAAGANFVESDIDSLRHTLVSDKTNFQKTNKSTVIETNATARVHAWESSEHVWNSNNDIVNHDMSSSDICVIDISADKSGDVQEINSSGSHCESLSFLDGLLDLASTFSQPQKNELLTPELYRRPFNKAEFVMSPPTPTLQVRVHTDPQMFLNLNFFYFLID